MRLHIPATQYTPEVKIDTESALMFIRGACFPENSPAFFKPIRSFLQKASELLQGGIKVHIELSYINSSAQREFYEMLRELVSWIPQTQVIIYLGEEEEEEDLRHVVAALREEVGFERIEYRFEYYSDLMTAEESPPGER
ncbi:MAG: SiaC family regulatory phosphoprotein [Bacteroidia bacterium]